MQKKDLSSNIKKIMVVYLILILGLITYIAYFQLIKGPEIADKSTNNRLWAKRNEVLRGSIYDRNGNALTEGKKTGDLTQSRVYTEGRLFSHTLGYVNEKYGIAGLEKLYDSELTNYRSITLKNFLKTFNFKEDFKNRKKDNIKVGNSIVTTLDTNLQKVAFSALGMNQGAIVALDPKTGEILASVSKPDFDPNDLEQVMKTAHSIKDPNKSILLNRAVSGLYPPGSVFKIVTLTSALENMSGVENRTFNDNGKLEFKDGYELWNDKKSAHGSISLRKALSVSSNVVFGTLAMELGNDKLKNTAEKFGFNKGVSSDGVVIDNSQFPTLSKEKKGEIAQSGIGQASVLASPMQMALVAATVANDGVMMEPKLVNKVINKDGETVKNIGTKEIARIMSEKDANTIQSYMETVVKDRINSNWTFFRGLDAAGKTGTAQHKEGDIAHSWFIGFAPANNPKIAIAVIVENGGAGSGIASQIAAKVIRAAEGK